MSYQIPNVVSYVHMKGVTKIPMLEFTPEMDLKYKYLVQTLFIRGLISSNFQMKINIYFDNQFRRLALSSNTINNFDIVRVGDFYCELRFDFPDLGNILAIGNSYYVEFELSGTYAYDDNNYLGLIIDYDSPAAIFFNDMIVLRQSSFFEIS